MGRKSTLTPEQLLEVERRHLVGGESINSLAKEFKVNESSLRRKIKPNKAEQQNNGNSLKSLAEEKVRIDLASKSITERIAELPYAKQEIVSDLAKKLMVISGHLGGAAEFGASTAHRLSGIANAKVMEIDDAAPLDAESLEALKGVMALTKTANEAAFIPMGLLAANKETIKDMNQTAKPVPSRVSVMIEDASMPDAEVK